MKLQFVVRVAVLLAACSLVLSVARVQSARAQSTAEPGSDDAYSRKGADTCIACHDDPVSLAVFQTRHGVPSDPTGPFGHGQLQCEACHGPGGAHAPRVRRGQERPRLIEFGANSDTPADVQNGMCLGCHNDEVANGWHTGPHDNDEITCANCHVSHTPRDPVLAAATQPAICFECHQMQRSEILRAFSHPFLEGKMDCGGCHSPHDSSTITQFARQTLNDTCYDCHAEKRGPFLWEHAPVSEDCGLCHAAHGSNHPGMLTSRAPLLCQSCHSQSGHPSIAQDADGLASASPSQYLLGQSCMNCHEQVHGSNHPSGSKLTR